MALGPWLWDHGSGTLDMTLDMTLDLTPRYDPGYDPGSWLWPLSLICTLSYSCFIVFLASRADTGQTGQTGRI